ncbi:DNA recombination protein RmuC [Spiroplasma clarkii]|uniref:DNA recombination protein RmuC n=1 Tax=Spiroplasma clarkii TaxID=2139 RepID=UPI002029B3F5|nr:DNA recombination protein RmuC [Spiroplasma clarkii]
MSNASHEITKQFADLATKAQPIAEVKEKVNKLDVLLSQNNKTGKAGEYLLERIFDNIINTKGNDKIIFERQYTMKKVTDGGKGLTVDMFIKGDGSKYVNIPVDAKFPFNAYTELVNLTEGSQNYKAAETNFKADVKKELRSVQNTLVMLIKQFMLLCSFQVKVFSHF